MVLVLLVARLLDDPTVSHCHVCDRAIALVAPGSPGKLRKVDDTFLASPAASCSPTAVQNGAIFPNHFQPSPGCLATRALAKPQMLRYVAIEADQN